MQSASYIRGPQAPLLEASIGQVLTQTALKYPDKSALIVRHQNLRLTWSQVEAEVDRTARGLIGMGLRAGDRIGVWATNCVEWVLLQYACGRTGVILVNVNPAYRSHELRYVLQMSRMRALFLNERDSRADYAAILKESRNGDRLPLEHIIYLGTDSWNEMISNGVEPAAARSAARRCRQYSVHLRHYRFAQRGDAHSPQSAEQRRRNRELPERRSGRPNLRAGATLPLLRMRNRFNGVR